jgi:hypothetical protein
VKSTGTEEGTGTGIGEGEAASWAKAMPEKSGLEVKRPVTKMAEAALRVSNTDI